MEKPFRHFAELTDARVERTKDTHSREFIAIAAGLCGAETWNGIEFYGKTKRNWPKKFLRLPSGIPSHDTFNRCFPHLILRVGNMFYGLGTDRGQLSDGGSVSIDGKAIRAPANPAVSAGVSLFGP
jgi:hypothetical protein